MNTRKSQRRRICPTSAPGVLAQTLLYGRPQFNVMHLYLLKLRERSDVRVDVGRSARCCRTTSPILSLGARAGDAIMQKGGHRLTVIGGVIKAHQNPQATRDQEAACVMT